MEHDNDNGPCACGAWHAPGDSDIEAIRVSVKAFLSSHESGSRSIIADMAESALNQRMRKALRHYDPVRVENVVCAGTPDMNCTLGWIENKFLDHWPKNLELIVKCNHYTPEQRVWARRRIAMGGPVWLMIQVGRDYLLFRGDVAAEHLGYATQDGLRTCAEKCWYGTINDKELVECLQNWRQL